MRRSKKTKTVEHWTQEILETENQESILTYAATVLAQDHPLNKLNKQLADAQAALIQVFKSDEEQQNHHEIQKFSLQIKLLENAIECRQQLHRERSYFLEKKVAEAGIFAIQKNNKKRTSTHKIIRKIRKGSIRYMPGEELTAFDAKVLMSLHKLWENKGKSKEITVNMYEILKACHMNPSGDAYNLLENSLLRLFRAEIVFKNETNDTESETFVHLLQEVGFERGRAEKGKEAKFTLMFTDRIYNSMTAGYFERFSGALLTDLSTSTAQILMIALQPEFKNSQYEWTLDEVCEMIDLASPRPSLRKSSIQKALSELETYQYIQQYRIWDDYSGLTKVWAVPGEILLEDRVIQENWARYTGKIKEWATPK
nr:replication initiator protein A [Fredinandcohnia onubensis]